MGLLLSNRHAFCSYVERIDYCKFYLIIQRLRLIIVMTERILNTETPLIQGGRESRAFGVYTYSIPRSDGRGEILLSGNRAAVASLFGDLPRGGEIRRSTIAFFLGNAAVDIGKLVSNVAVKMRAAGVTLVETDNGSGYQLEEFGSKRTREALAQHLRNADPKVVNEHQRETERAVEDDRGRMRQIAHEIAQQPRQRNTSKRSLH
jgi:hypothetical protein